MNDFKSYQCFVDRVFPVVFSRFQLKEMIRCLSCYRLTLPPDQVLALDEIIHMLETHLKNIDKFESSIVD